MRDRAMPSIGVGPRLWSPWAGIVLATALLALVAGSLAFEPRLAELGVTDYVERYAAFRAAAAVSLGVPGAVLVAIRPRNTVGWLMLGIGLAQALGVFGEAYGLVGIHDPGPGLPGADWVMWVSAWLWAPALLLIPTLLPLVFPVGRPPSPRWRPAVAVAVLAATSGAVGWALLPAGDNDVAGLYPVGYAGPVATSSAALPLMGLSLGLAALGATLALASLLQRYRRAPGREREQLKWVLVAALATAGLWAAGVAGAPFGPVIMAAAMVPVPSAIAVAIVQHRLWDIDVVLRRSLVFGVLVASGVSVYVLAVLVLGGILGDRTGAPLVATALVAVGIEPAHQWLRRRMNQVVFGDRRDPGEAMRRLGERLAGAIAPDAVLPELTESVGRALRVSYVAVEDDTHVRDEWGDPVPERTRVPLLHRGARVGTLVIGTDRADEIRPRDAKVLTDLAPHVAMIVHALCLSEDLARSNARLAAARDDERERLRRDLHDGLGPTLAGLALEVDRGRLRVGREPDTAPVLLDGLSARIREAVRDVRSIVDDLRPASLDALGLVGALEEVGRGFSGSLLVDVDVAGALPDLPPGVELSAYRIVSEAVTNVARHSGATRCSVEIRARDGMELRIVDDGRGLPDQSSEGVGIRSMRRRASDLGGSLELRRAEKGGTMVVVLLPLGIEGRAV